MKRHLLYRPSIPYARSAAICNNGVTNEWDTAAVIRRAESTLIARFPCQNVTSVISRAIRTRFDWHRIGIAIGVLIVIVAAVILFQLLRDIDAEKVVAALQAKSLWDVLIASVFVAIGYTALTFYDFFALRTIGRDAVPYRVAALTGFIAYTFGHNFGATVVTAGLVRLRIYSAWGLSVVEIAKIAFVTGLTFWLGNAFVLGAGMTYAPAAASAVNQLPAWLNRTIGVSGLAMIVGYLLWLMPRPRVIGRSFWKIALPNPRSTLLQIGIGALDLGAGAITMYILLPTYPSVDFVILLVVFVTAILFGFASHAPGSLGVIEVAMLVGLPQFAKEELLASLLIFRFLYFILPFSVAAILLGLRESTLIARSATDLNERNARQLRKRGRSDCQAL
jgi:glycosyltransferase 2 family protein